MSWMISDTTFSEIKHVKGIVVFFNITTEQQRYYFQVKKSILITIQSSVAPGLSPVFLEG